MSTEETNILNRWQYANADNYIMFRNNTGMFLTLDGKRKTQAGLGKGTSDLIGWETLLITADMVGTRIARFVAVEGKVKNGKLSPEQQKFIDAVNRAGGKGIVVRGD